MKLLLDENLSPRLVERLRNLYPESAHVHDCGLGGAGDSAVWDYANLHGYAIVSKDSDFAERSVLEGAPPKVIWLRLGNCTTNDVFEVLQTHDASLRHFSSQDLETCLVLDRV